MTTTYTTTGHGRCPVNPARLPLTAASLVLLLAFQVLAPWAPEARAESNRVRLRIQAIPNQQVLLSWRAATNCAYQLEHSREMNSWSLAGPPQAAPEGGGVLQGVVDSEHPQAFFRVRLLSLTNTVVPTTPGHHPQLHMVHDGLPRTYRLFIPSGYTGISPTPLAFILHGHGQTSDSFAQRHPDLFREADQLGMIVVLPDGINSGHGTGWNKLGHTEAFDYVDDVAFIVDLLERLKGDLAIDEKRVYAGGFSAGGSMSHYLGAMTTNVFAALSAVGSGIQGIDPDVPETFVNPPPAGPMPVLTVNATNDCGWPYWGGLNENGRISHSAMDAVRFWTTPNLCLNPPSVRTNLVVTNGIHRGNFCGPKPPANMVQTNLVVTMRWTNCVPGTEVVFVTLTDGGHIWPDADDNVGFDANRTVLNFFMRHARP